MCVSGEQDGGRMPQAQDPLPSSPGTGREEEPWRQSQRCVQHLHQHTQHVWSQRPADAQHGQPA